MAGVKIFNICHGRSLLRNMSHHRVCVGRRGWCSALGCFAVQHALSHKTQETCHIIGQGGHQYLVF